MSNMDSHGLEDFLLSQSDKEATMLKSENNAESGKSSVTATASKFNSTFRRKIITPLHAYDFDT